MATLTIAEQNFLAEVQRCRGSFRYFCRTILHIEFLEHNQTRLIPFRLNEAQKQTIESLEQYGTTYVLKARRLGISTVVLAYFFWKILFHKGFKCATLAHTDEAAEEVFKIVKTFHANMPDAWRMLFPLDIDSADTMRIKGGGTYRVGSARSAGFRGSGLNILHLSEFAYYPRIDETLEHVAATLPPGARIVWETTPNGFNRAYDIWVGSEEDDGIRRLFFPWTMEPRYAIGEPPPSIPDDMVAYRATHHLSPEQFYWACWQYLQRYAGNLAGFNREFPINPTVAFTISGARVWPNLVFPDALRAFFTGHKQYLPPTDYHLYSAGADPAGGGPKGDYSALVILDCTDKKNPKVAHTFYAKVPTPEFAKEVYDTCLRYRAVIAVERNNHGNEIINRLVEMQYPFLYTKEAVGVIDKKWTKVIGFDTSTTGRPILVGLMHQYIGAGILQPVCPRLQLEINTFEHVDHEGRLRQEARKGCHDDMLFSAALALEAMSQTYQVEKVVLQQRPTTLDEVYRYQKATKKKYRHDDPGFEPDPLEQALEGQGNNPGAMRSLMDRGA